MTPEELAAIRERAGRNGRSNLELLFPTRAERDRVQLLAEVERLTERQRVEPVFQCDTHLCGSCSGCKAAGIRDEWTRLRRQRDTLQARIDKVRALHTCELGGTPTGEPADVCSCGVSYYPCPTIQCLDGSDQ